MHVIILIGSLYEFKKKLFIILVIENKKQLDLSPLLLISQLLKNQFP
jgi:hypothetical protein